MPFSYKEFFNREGGMSLDTMLVTTVKGQVIIIGHWICALIWSLVHARWGRRIERARARIGGETATFSSTCGSPASAPRPPRPACPRTGPT